MLTVTAYVVYLVVCIAITLWVANVLFNNARVFFNDIFHQNEALADSVNKLLKVGFYLVNIGVILLLLENGNVMDNKELFEVLSVKVGGIILLLGAMHLTNVYLFFKLRKRANINAILEGDTDAVHPYFGKPIAEQLKDFEEGGELG